MRASPPVLVFVQHGTLVIGSDAGEWFALGAGDRLDALGSTGPMSAAVQDARGVVTVASWAPRLMQLRDGGWTTIALAAPALALAVTPRGLVLADGGGGLALLAETARAPVQELSAGAAVVGLAPCGGGVVALLATGGVVATAWPDAAASALVPLETSMVGRVHAMFPGFTATSVLLAGARGLGMVVRDRVVAVAGEPAGRIAGAAMLGGGRAVVHTDEGDGWIVDDRLDRTARLAIAEIAGCTASADGGALVWTWSGALYAIDRAGGHRALADGDVVLAAPEVGRIGAIAIRWAAATGVRVTRGEATWT